MNSHTLLIMLIWALICNWANRNCSGHPPSFLCIFFTAAPAFGSGFCFDFPVAKSKKVRQALIILYHKHFTGKEIEISTNSVFPKAHPHDLCSSSTFSLFSSGFPKKGRAACCFPLHSHVYDSSCCPLSQILLPLLGQGRGRCVRC